jgi:hypothetical protein
VFIPALKGQQMSLNFIFIEIDFLVYIVFAEIHYLALLRRIYRVYGNNRQEMLITLSTLLVNYLQRTQLYAGPCQGLRYRKMNAYVVMHGYGILFRIGVGILTILKRSYTEET